jgi:hypothetical protein
MCPSVDDCNARAGEYDICGNIEQSSESSLPSC